MTKKCTLNRMLSIATLAMMFGAATAHAQSSGSTSSGKMGEAGANTTDASGKTQANREGRMSPTGQNATTSTKPNSTSSSK